MLFQLLNYETNNVTNQTKSYIPIYIFLSMIKFFLHLRLVICNILSEA